MVDVPGFDSDEVTLTPRWSLEKSGRHAQEKMGSKKAEKCGQAVWRRAVRTSSKSFVKRQAGRQKEE